MSDIALPDPARPCSACAHFKIDGRHPLHAALCDRLSGRLLSAASERALPPPNCGPEGRDFVSRGIAP